MQLPMDNPETFPGIPLQGHLCSMRRDNEKHYWRVERLISESKNLPVGRAEVEVLIGRLGNGTWFGVNERATIKSVLAHIKRAMSADLMCPIILSSDGKIMDGTHRLVAASLKGIKEIPTVQFSLDPIPEHIEANKEVGV